MIELLENVVDEHFVRVEKSIINLKYVHEKLFKKLETRSKKNQVNDLNYCLISFLN